MMSYSNFSPLDQNSPLNVGDQVAILLKPWTIFGTVTEVNESGEKSCNPEVQPESGPPNQSEDYYKVYSVGNSFNFTGIYGRSQLCLIDRYLKVGSWGNVLTPYITDLLHHDEHFTEETPVIVRSKKVLATLQMLGNPAILFVDVPISRLEPVSRFLQGDIVTCNNWIGKVLTVHRKIILHHLESNKTYKVDEDIFLGSILQNKLEPFQHQLHEGQDLKSIPFDIKSPFINESFERMELLSGCIVKHIIPMSMDVDWRDCLSPAEDGNLKPPLKIERESGYVVDRMIDFDKPIRIGEKFLMTPGHDDYAVKFVDFYNNWNDGFDTSNKDMRYPFQPERMFLRSFKVVYTRTVLDCILMNGRTFKLDTKKIVPYELFGIHDTPLPNEIMSKSYDIEENHHGKIGQILGTIGDDNIVNVGWQDTTSNRPLENSEESYFSLRRSKYNYSAGSVVKFSNHLSRSRPKTFGYYLYPLPNFRCTVKDPKAKNGEIHILKNIQVVDMGEVDVKDQNDSVDSGDIDIGFGYDSSWDLVDFSQIFPFPLNQLCIDEVPKGIARAVLSKPLPMDFDGKLKRVLVDAIKDIGKISPDDGTFCCYLDRIDVISFAIFGTLDTVYEHFLFIFDAWLPEDFPNTEPEFYYRSFSKKEWLVSPLIDAKTGRLDLGYLNWNSNMSLTDVLTHIKEYVFCREPIILQGPSYDEDGRGYNEEIYLQLVDSSLNQILSPPLSLSPFQKLFESYIDDNIGAQFRRLGKWKEFDNLNWNPADDREVSPALLDCLLQYPLLPLSRGAHKTLDEIISKCMEIRHLELAPEEDDPPEFEYDYDEFDNDYDEDDEF